MYLPRSILSSQATQIHALFFLAIKNNLCCPTDLVSVVFNWIITNLPVATFLEKNRVTHFQG